MRTPWAHGIEILIEEDVSSVPGFNQIVGIILLAVGCIEASIESQPGLRERVTGSASISTSQKCVFGGTFDAMNTQTSNPIFSVWGGQS